MSNNSTYKRLKETWELQNKPTVEDFAPKITMPYSQWINYISSGQHIVGADAIIPSGTVNTGYGGGGAVYKGHVRQGWYGI